MIPKVQYCHAKETLTTQKKAVQEKIKEKSSSYVIYDGIDMPKDEDGKRRIDPLDVPGVRK